MDVTARTTVSAPPERAFAALADLSTYPGWLGIVRSSTPAPAHREDAGPAWDVEVGARLGPVWRTKRVRMVRTEHRPPSAVRFERAEQDGRTHSPWVLTADVDAPDGGSGAGVAVRLHYGGSLWMPLVELALKAEMSRAGDRLDEHLSS